MPKVGLRYHDFFRRLKAYGVVEVPGRGKGSERFLVREIPPGSKKGPFYTLKCHGKGNTVKKRNNASLPQTISNRLKRILEKEVD